MVSNRLSLDTNKYYVGRWLHSNGYCWIVLRTIQVGVRTVTGLRLIVVSNKLVGVCSNGSSLDSTILVCIGGYLRGNWFCWIVLSTI